MMFLLRFLVRVRVVVVRCVLVYCVVVGLLLRELKFLCLLIRGMCSVYFWVSWMSVL